MFVGESSKDLQAGLRCEGVSMDTGTGTHQEQPALQHGVVRRTNLLLWSGSGGLSLLPAQSKCMVVVVTRVWLSW